MGKALEQLGMTAAGQVVGAGMGLLLEGHNDRRQLRQQGKLNDLQIKGQKELTDYNNQKQLEMWKATSYPGQMEMMKKAGINPALMYGMGGGGGVTVGSGGSGNVSGGEAPKGGGETLAASGMALQMGMLQAQIENIKADTKVKEAEVPNKEASTQSTLAGIDKLIAETDNVKIKTDLEKVNKSIKELELYIGNETAEDNIDKVAWMTDKALYELEMTERENFIGKATREDVIKTIKAGAVGAVLRNVLTRAETKNINKDTELKGQQISESASRIKLNDQQIKTMAQNLMMGWDQLGQKDKELRVRDQLAQYETDPMRGIERIVTSALDEVIGRWPKSRTTTRETFNDGEGNSYETRKERY